MFNAPFVDARRSALNTNDLRGKVLRIKVNDDGSYTMPDGNLFAESGTRRKTRPEIYAMGFRNPFRIQVDEQRRRLRDRLLARLADCRRTFRGPAGTGRVEIVRKPGNYGWPLCYRTDLPYYRWNFNTSTPLDPRPAAVRVRQPARGPAEHLALEHRAVTEPTPPITKPDLWYSYQDNANPPLGTPCFGVLRRLRRPCPQLFPELLQRRRRSARRGPVRLRRGQPEPDEVPAVLRRRVLPRRVHA